MIAPALVPMPEPEYAAWRTLETERLMRWMYLPLLADPATARQRAEADLARLLDGGAATDGGPGGPSAQVCRVVDAGGTARGWVFLRGGATDLSVIDAEAEIAPDVLLALLTERAAGAARLLLQRMVGVPTLEVLAGAGRFVPTASNMVLDLRGLAGADSRLRLVPMDADRFEEWLAAAVDGYARQIEESTALDHEASLRKAERDTAELLPQGHSTDDHWFFDAVDGETTVGTIWLSRRSPTAYYVYEVEVDAGRRGCGYGRAAMDAAAWWARDQGGEVLALNVFGRNAVARRLYLGLGYRVVFEELELDLAAEPASGRVGAQ